MLPKLSPGVCAYTIFEEGFLPSIYAQLLHHVALCLHTLFATQLQSAGRASASCFKASLTMQWLDDACDLVGQRLNIRLAQTIASCRRELAGRTTVGSMTDKGIVHGLPSQASLIATPSNMICLTTPGVEHRKGKR